jgi:hypothetical protein
MIEMFAMPSPTWVASSIPGLLAIGLASTVPWALGLRLPPLAGGVVCLLIVVLTLALPDGVAFMRFAAAAEEGSLLHQLRFAATAVVFPMMLLGPAVERGLGPFVLTVNVTAIGLGLAAGVMYIVRRDYTLAAS